LRLVTSSRAPRPAYASRSAATSRSRAPGESQFADASSRVPKSWFPATANVAERRLEPAEDLRAFVELVAGARSPVQTTRSVVPSIAAINFEPAPVGGAG